MSHSDIQDLSFPCEVSATPFTLNRRKWLLVPKTSNGLLDARTFGRSRSPGAYTADMSNRQIWASVVDPRLSKRRLRSSASMPLMPASSRDGNHYGPRHAGPGTCVAPTDQLTSTKVLTLSLVSRS